MAFREHPNFTVENVPAGHGIDKDGDYKRVRTGRRRQHTAGARRAKSAPERWGFTPIETPDATPMFAAAVADGIEARDDDALAYVRSVAGDPRVSAAARAFAAAVAGASDVRTARALQAADTRRERYDRMRNAVA